MTTAPAHKWRAGAAACILSAAGGSMDAWVYIGHGHVFANAQTGNVVLAAIALAAGDGRTTLRHAPSMLAFCLGIALSRLSGRWLKQRGRNSRTPRLVSEAAALAALTGWAGHLNDGIVSACVGFLAAVQITAFSHVGPWSFNTGMTTGNLNSGVTAAIAAWGGPAGDGRWAQARLTLLLCLCFVAGATAGGAATLRFGDLALFATAATVLAASALMRALPDPVP